MPSNQPETPSTDALDAAVEEAVEVVESLFRYDGRPEQRAVRDLVAAVEARAVARERGRECVWTAEKRPMSMSLTGVAYRICTGKVMLLPTEFCPSCGGRVRVEHAETALAFTPEAPDAK
jgi:hypothetical protein